MTRHIPRALAAACAAACAAFALATPLAAQSLAQRVAAVKNGTVRLSFTSRPGVCGNGRGNISTGRNTSRSRNDEWTDECEPGPVRVAADIADGAIVALRTYVGGRWKSPGDAKDFGTVGVKDATDWLLNTVARGEGKAANEAIFPATIADSVVVWPELLAIAKDDKFSRATRQQAVFWVSQAAGDKATEGLTAIVGDPTGDREVRKQAVFAISQRPKDEGIPALLNVARTSKDPEIRKSAIFWLGQSRDARAIEYFEKVLLGKD